MTQAGTALVKVSQRKTGVYPEARLLLDEWGKEALAALLVWKGKETCRVEGEAEDGGRLLGLESSVWGSRSSLATREGSCVA